MYINSMRLMLLPFLIFALMLGSKPSVRDMSLIKDDVKLTGIVSQATINLLFKQKIDGKTKAIESIFFRELSSQFLGGLSVVLQTTASLDSPLYILYCSLIL